MNEWYQRRYPGASPPARFDPADVQRVTRCAAAVEGDLETKLQALRDAIAGAFRVSDRPPTARYIWGALPHFLAHVERGRRERRARERERGDLTARPPPPPAPRTRRSPPTADGFTSPEKISADLDRLFGPNWRARR
jgi:hypothetical protein